MNQQTITKIKQNAIALVETILSAIVIVVIYAVYVPFSIVRGLVSRELINDFFTDALYLLDSVRAALTFKKHKLK